MKIISIDVGIKNFAYVILNSSDGICDIEAWGVLELCDKSVNASKVDLIKIGHEMNKKFNEAFDETRFDKIVIENQIGRNAIRMKMVQGMISMYFIMKGYSTTDILNYNAIHKLKNFMKSKTKTTYQERKNYRKTYVTSL